MSAGIVKTPNTTLSKEGNVSKSSDRSGNTSSGGKKFVQTRLPFKLIAPVTKDAAPAGSSNSSASSVVDLDSEQAEREPRKRKLSYQCSKDSDEEVESDQLRRSNSKENLKISESTAACNKKPKTVELMAEDIIELDDDDVNEEKDIKKADEVNKKLKKKKIAECTIQSPPIQIKLPMASKRTIRRKSLRKAEVVPRSDSSDDIETMAESLNPQKRRKVVRADATADSKTSVQNKVKPQNKAKAEPEEKAKSKGEVDTKNKPESKKSNSTEKAEVDVESDVVLLDDTSDNEENSEHSSNEMDIDVDMDTVNKTLPEENAGKKLKEKKAEGKELKKKTKEAEEEEKKTDEDPKEREEKSDKKSIKHTPLEEKSTKEEREGNKEQNKQKAGKQSDEEELEPEEDREGKSASTAASVAAQKLRNLTPKQQRLQEQRRKAREEKERKLQEERRLKQLEKEQREQQKKAERDEKEEQRRKEREDKEELKRKEREEKERKRQAELEERERKRQAENEEKRKRNEAKEEVQRKKDEERRRKEQEKEDAEMKKKRAAATFSKFFVPKQPKHSKGNALEHDQNSSDCDPSQTNSQPLAFRPFQVKGDMIVAPVTRVTLASDARQQLDKLFHVPSDAEQEEDDSSNIGRIKRPTRAQLYLNELSQGKHKPLSSKRDARLDRSAKDEEDDDDVQVIDELASAGTPIIEDRPKQVPWMRAKYLQFADNRRPPYYGTWRKRSQVVTARRPLGQDKSCFDYEVDSDCEWEEEEPGESLSASEDEKERESEEESEEEYNEWFVPHGHLSDEELQNDGELEDGNTREAQKAKLQVLQQEFAQEMKKQTKKIKPRLLGPVWLDKNGNKSELFPEVFIQMIDMYGCWQLQPLTLEPPADSAGEEESVEDTKLKPATMQLDDQLIQQFVRLIHGNSQAKVFLISEYLEYLKTQMPPESQILLPSKAQLREKFDELATWQAVEQTSTNKNSKKSKKPKKRLSWVVNTEALHRYQLDDLTLQNQWNYTLTPKGNRLDTSLLEGSPPADTNADTEPGKDLDSTPTTSAASINSSNTKKRATILMSVPRDQQFPVASKNALISQYLRKQQDMPTKKESLATPQPPTNSTDDVVLLSD